MKKIASALALLVFMALVFTSCGGNSEQKTTEGDSVEVFKPGTGVQQKEWGESDDKQVYLYTLTNKAGDEIKISNYGATITSWVTADKKGDRSSIVLGFDSLSGYLAKPPYFGATIGRYGNRIGDARFSLDGNTYTLKANDGKNHLHGGEKGFDKVIWEAVTTTDTLPSLTLKYLSVDGEEGYPGNLAVSVKFTLSDDNELTIEYHATTDKATPVNLTNHSYFNLTGDVANTILPHRLMIRADKYTPVDSTLIPTGELKDVKGSPFDFTSVQTIGSRINQVPGGYDHNWVLNKKEGVELIATLSDTVSGRKLEVYTQEPGLQFYSGNFLDGKFKSASGTPINQHTALCLETQHFPDSPNKPAFPTTILKAGETYHTVTKYKVVLEKK